jgi:hypothetical protein
MRGKPNCSGKDEARRIAANSLGPRGSGREHNVAFELAPLGFSHSRGSAQLFVSLTTACGRSRPLTFSCATRPSHPRTRLSDCAAASASAGSKDRLRSPLAPFRFIFGGRKRHTRHRFDPDKMVVYLFDAGNILSGDDESLTLAIIGDDPP